MPHRAVPGCTAHAVTTPSGPCTVPRTAGAHCGTSFPTFLKVTLGRTRGAGQGVPRGAAWAPRHPLVPRPPSGPRTHAASCSCFSKCATRARAAAAMAAFPPCSPASAPLRANPGCHPIPATQVWGTGSPGA